MSRTQSKKNIFVYTHWMSFQALIALDGMLYQYISNDYLKYEYTSSQ